MYSNFELGKHGLREKALHPSKAGNIGDVKTERLQIKVEKVIPELPRDNKRSFNHGARYHRNG